MGKADRDADLVQWSEPAVRDLQVAGGRVHVGLDGDHETTIGVPLGECYGRVHGLVDGDLLWESQGHIDRLDLAKGKVVARERGGTIDSPLRRGRVRTTATRGPGTISTSAGGLRWGGTS